MGWLSRRRYRATRVGGLPRWRHRANTTVRDAGVRGGCLMKIRAATDEKQNEQVSHARNTADLPGYFKVHTGARRAAGV